VHLLHFCIAQPEILLHHEGLGFGALLRRRLLEGIDIGRERGAAIISDTTTTTVWMVGARRMAPP
jgi:hypothetical protein